MLILIDQDYNAKTKVPGAQKAPDTRIARNEIIQLYP